MTDDQEKDLSSADPQSHDAAESVAADVPSEEGDAPIENAEAMDNQADGASDEMLESIDGITPDDSDKVVNADDASEDDAEAAMLAMLEGLPDEEQKASADDINFGAASVSNAEFQQLQEPARAAETRNIELLMDVDLPVSIELGRTKMSINDILGLGPGSVVELNKLAGEPVDLLVNYKVVAKGEVVVVDENFGLRVTQLMTPEERLKALAQE